MTREPVSPNRIRNVKPSQKLVEGNKGDVGFAFGRIAFRDWSGPEGYSWDSLLSFAVALSTVCASGILRFSGAASGQILPSQLESVLGNAGRGPLITRSQRTLSRLERERSSEREREKKSRMLDRKPLLSSDGHHRKQRCSVISSHKLSLRTSPTLS